MREKGIVIIGPAWYSCGSYEVFKRQIQCVRSLGLKSYFLATSPTLGIGNNNPYWDYYYNATPDLDEDIRGHTARSRLFFKHANFWKNLPSVLGCSVAKARLVNAGLMSVPETLKEFLESHDVDTIICHHYFNLPFSRKVKKLIPNAQIILETQDLQSNHYETSNQIHPVTRRRSTFEENVRDEMKACEEADILIHYNEDETEKFRKHLPRKRHLTVFPAFPRNYDISKKAEKNSQLFDFLIVASGNDPNYRSMSWFLEHVWSSELDNKFDLRIAGNVDALFIMYGDPMYEKYKHRFLGRVDNLDDLYRGARHLLLPVTEGQGISIKTIECLSYGKSIISSPLAFRGFSKKVPEKLFLEAATSAEEMRSKILNADVKAKPKHDKRVSGLYEALFTVEAQKEIYQSLLVK